MARFDKAFFRVVEKSGTTYNIKETLQNVGYFRIKSTPMGANLYLLEEGDIRALIKEDRTWVS